MPGSEIDRVQPIALRRSIVPKGRTPTNGLPPEVVSLLKQGPEQQTVVGPMVVRLLGLGWKFEQILFGHREWRVPRSPSQATVRERGHSFEGHPVDITIFDST